MSKYTKFEGTVSKTARNGGAFEIDGEWYSIFKPAQLKGQKVEPGDFLKFEYELVEKGGKEFRNIKGDVEVVAAQRSSGGGSTGGGGQTNREKHIVRQNVLGHATALVVAGEMGSLETAIEDVIATARLLEEYVLESE